MSFLTPVFYQKTEPSAARKLMYSAALAGIALSFTAIDARADDQGLLNGVGNTVSGITSGLTDTVHGLGTTDSSDSGHLSLGTNNDLSMNAAAQRSDADYGLQGSATQDTTASVNLNDIDQAQAARVTSSGAIVLD